ncbi:MAG: hypothetical protein ACYC2H_11445 [Thermoplasmatota archaeon]
MFLHRLAAGLVFASGAGLSRLGVTGESFLLIGLGLGAALGGLTWFASSGRPVSARRIPSARKVPVAEASPTR